MISPSFQCDITSYSTWYHFAVQARWYHFEKLGDITYLSRWYHFESYVISPSLSKWYHLLSKLCDITLIIKWYHLVQLVISLSSKVISHYNQVDITSKAKTAPHKILSKNSSIFVCKRKLWHYLNPLSHHFCTSDRLQVDSVGGGGGCGSDSKHWYIKFISGWARIGR